MYSDLLSIVRASLPTEEEFVIIAESYSGPLAILAAAEQPKGLAGIVLAASFCRAPAPRWTSPLRALVRPWLLRLTPWPVLARSLLGRDARSNPLATEVRRVVAGVPADVLAARLREVLSVDVTQKLKQVAVPILYLAGSWDVLVGGASARLIQRYAQNFRLVNLDAPHLVLQVASAEAAHEISQFIAHAIAF